MKLWYFYVRDRRIAMEHCMTDGHFDLLNWIMREGLVDEAYMIIENYTQPVREHLTEDGLRVLQIPSIENACPQVGDIVWIRGGWKPWIPQIERWKKRGVWMLYYDAATGHKCWPFWDIILTELRSENHFDRLGRLWMRYPKPISELFKPLDLPLRYDLMLGSSHVFDRKGQFRSFRIVLEYEKLYGEKLRCVLPGGYYQTEANTMQMRREIDAYPHIEVPGSVPRGDLHRLYCQSRLYIGMAGGGYGDRGPVEAGTCGCPLILKGTKWHAPYTTDPAVCWVPDGTTWHRERPQEPPPTLYYREVAEGIRTRLEAAQGRRQAVAEHFRLNASIPTGSGPVLRRIIEFCREFPLAGRERLAILNEDRCDNDSNATA